MYIPYNCQAFELEGNINQLPYFNPDLTLASPSPCIDAGVDYYYYWDQLMIDIPPDQYFGNAPDMGAYENWDVQVSTPEPEINSKDWIKVFPNPSNTTLNVEILNPLDNLVKLSLYDVRGNRISDHNYRVNKLGNNTIEISMEGLSNGTYILVAENKHGTIQKKVIH